MVGGAAVNGAMPFPAEVQLTNCQAWLVGWPERAIMLSSWVAGNPWLHAESPSDQFVEGVVDRRSLEGG